MGYRYIYDKYGNLKAVIAEDDHTATVIDVHKGVVGNVIKEKMDSERWLTHLKKV